MNNTDKRQMIEEIVALGKTKENSSTFMKAFKGAVTLKNIEKILEDKKRAYNVAFSNLFRRYGIKHPDLFGDLDKIWYIVLNVDDESKQAESVGGIAVAAAASMGGSGLALGASSVAAVAATSVAIVLGPLLAAAGVFRIVWVEYKVYKIWKQYKENTKLYADKFVNSL